MHSVFLWATKLDRDLYPRRVNHFGPEIQTRAFFVLPEARINASISFIQIDELLQYLL
jgi:hypothetical protein